MKDTFLETDKEISNIRFSEIIFLQGKPLNNIQPGRYNAAITEVAGGLLIDIPAQGEYTRCLTKVPFSKVKQIEFKTS